VAKAAAERAKTTIGLRLRGFAIATTRPAPRHAATAIRSIRMSRRLLNARMIP
jgi:hypothetical protein